MFQLWIDGIMTTPEDKKDYHPLASTAATHAISAIGTELSGLPLLLDYAGKKVEVCTIADGITHLSLTTKKLFDYILLLLTRFNRNKGDWNNGAVRFTLRGYMIVMGYGDNRQSRARRFNTICEDLDKLASVMLKQGTADCFRLVGQYRFVGPKGTKYAKKDIGPKGARYTKKDVISGKSCFEVSVHQDLLVHLRSEGRRIVPFPTALFRHVKQNENAYALAKRMILHYFSNSRRNSKNKQKLKVATLLKCCPDKANQHTGNTRQTFEKALDSLAAQSGEDGPLIRWSYIVDGKSRTSAEVSAIRLSHEDWLELVVEFAPMGLYSNMHYSKMYFADRDDLDPPYKPSLANDKEEKMVMRKKKTDPKLFTPNAYIQNQLGLASGSMAELMTRRFTSLVCEQCWLARKMPSRFVKELRDGDGYLRLKDLTFPMRLLVDQTKSLSLTDCREKPMLQLLLDPIFEVEERILVVVPWTGGKSSYAQVGIRSDHSVNSTNIRPSTISARRH